MSPPGPGFGFEFSVCGRAFAGALELLAGRALLFFEAFVAETVFCKLGCGAPLAFDEEGMLD
jgi:hypothetical protein